jgi:molybdenum cofactor synthesis domain-containing protein
MTTAVLVVSSAVAAGAAEDRAGPLLAGLAGEAGAEVVAVEAVADDRDEIEARLRGHVAAGIELVLTAGGSGLTPDDVTPDATDAVVDRHAPGLAEALRAEALRHTPMGALTRGVAGSAGRTLIVNLPGSPKAIAEVFPAIAPALSHAVALIASPGGSRALHEASGEADGRA